MAAAAAAAAAALGVRLAARPDRVRCGVGEGAEGGRRSLWHSRPAGRCCQLVGGQIPEAVGPEGSEEMLGAAARGVISSAMDATEGVSK